MTGSPPSGGRVDQRGDERGSITAFVAVLTFALLCCAALVHDGGRLVVARNRVADVAENAARVGAQEIDGLRSGRWRIDPQRAAARSQRYLAEHGASGTVTVGERTVTVTVSTTTAMHLLGALGIGARTTVVTRTVEAVER